MDFVKIGQIAGVQGLDGKLILQYDRKGKNPFRQLKHVFVELKRESYIPYFIEAQKNINEEQVRVQLDEVNSVESARELLGKNIYVEKELYATLYPKGVGGDLTGFVIEDQALGRIGPIQSVFETPGQVIASVSYKGKEVLIPLAENIITRIDASVKTIKVVLPEGLLEVYL
jgi:16S rRNA processing protein RimM